jgi:uncharacterized membrane protein YhaH (DUF805 family)
MSSDRAPESLVSLWQDQPTSGFKMVPADFAKRMRKEVRNWRRSMWGGVTLFAFAALTSGWGLYQETDAMERLGLLLTMLVFVFFTGQILVHIRRLRAARFSVDRTTAPSLASARTYLEMRRDFHRGVWLWSRVIVLYPVVPVHVYTNEHNNPDAMLIMLVCLLVWTALMALIVFGIQLRTAKGYDCQLRELDDIERLSPVERYVAAHEQWK